MLQNSTGHCNGVSCSNRMVTLVPQDEVVEILNGTIGYTLEGDELATTTRVSIPVGKRHTIWNADPSTELHYKVSPLFDLIIRC